MKRKALVVDDDALCLDILTQFVTDKEFEVTSSTYPTCSLLAQKMDTCPMETPCYTTILSDYHMFGMTGLDLFEYQARCGCKVAPECKALISGAIPPAAQERAEACGYKVFHKPTPLHQIDTWFNTLPLSRVNHEEES